MPPRLAQTFTIEQLEAIRKAFGTRYKSSHLFEFKRLLRLPWGRFYVVVQMGRDQRSTDPVADRLSVTPRQGEKHSLAGTVAIAARQMHPSTPVGGQATATHPPDRRRPGRVENVNPALIPLLRHPAAVIDSEPAAADPQPGTVAPERLSLDRAEVA